MSDAGFRMGDGLARKHGDRFIVHDIAVVVDNAVLAVRGVRVKCYVGDYRQFRVRGLQGPDRGRYQPVRVGRFFAAQGFELLVDDRKQGNGRDTELCGSACLGHDAVNAEPFDARHGRDRFPALLTGQHKHRVNQVSRA